VPVAIRNNHPGKEAEVLARYKEPSWNNPVVRFLDPDGKDLIPRKDGVYDAAGILSRSIEALTTAKKEAPAWLIMAAEEAAAKDIRRVSFAMQ
jgi:hypothetical protein